MTSYIGYARVSTDKQGRSGLGMEAQEAAIRAYLTAGDTLLQPIMVEIESGKDNARPVLAQALAKCRLTGSTLLIAKLDRLSRNLAFIANLMESGVNFIACDMPHAKPFELHIRASLAEEERRMISARTTAALQAAKARGKVLGGYRGGPVVDGRLGASANRQMADAFAARVAPTLTELRAAGMSLDAIAHELGNRGIVTPRGGAWTATAVRRALARVAG